MRLDDDPSEGSRPPALISAGNAAERTSPPRTAFSTSRAEPGKSAATRSDRAAGTVHRQPRRLHAPAQGRPVVGDACDLSRDDRPRRSVAGYAHQPPVRVGHAALAGQGGRKRRAALHAAVERAVRHRRPDRARRRLLQGRRGRLRGRAAPAAAARAAVGRQVHTGDPAEARAGGVQLHRRRRAVRGGRLPGARIAAAPDSALAARGVSGRPTASTSRATSVRIAACRVEKEFGGDFMQMPVERIFISEAGRVGVGTYAPHDPTTADLADLVGSVDLVQGRGVRRRGRPARLVVVGRRVRGEPRRARDDRDPEGQARVPLPAADADAGEERQGVALSADPRRRDDRRAHQPRRVPQVPAGARRTRRCSTGWSSSRSRTRSTTGTRRASTASSFPAPSRRSAKCTSIRTCCTPRPCSRS